MLPMTKGLVQKMSKASFGKIENTYIYPMKKLIFCTILGTLLFSCKETPKTIEHPESHTASVNFTVTDAANVASYNVYRGDYLIEQLVASKKDNMRYTVQDAIPITSHPYDLKYSVEPMFMDSVANTSIHLEIEVDSMVIAESDNGSVLFGEVASLSCTGQ